MPSNGYAGQLRRSQMIATYGPGAVVDFAVPPKGHPVSGIVSGLDFWDDVAPDGQRGLSHPQVIHEIRLQRRLHVQGFRLPPVVDAEGAAERIRDVLHIARFPRWLLCPICHRLENYRQWASDEQDPTSAARFCTDCKVDGQRVAVVPPRFVVACEKGHIDDFPWKAWIGCRCESPRLSLRTTGAGLSGLLLSCSNSGCGSSPRTMADVFAPKALLSVIGTCSGERPWLGDREACDRPMKVLQRGGSTVHFAQIESALDIPPYSADTTGQLADAVAFIREEALQPAQWGMMIKMRALVQKTGWTEDRIKAYFEQCMRHTEDRDAPLTWEEFGQFERACASVVDENEFKVVPDTVPAELSSVISGVARATRLREVRVMTGFARVNPPSGAFRGSGDTARISLADLKWLPGVEIHGEGIFIRFDEERLREWENRPNVQQRFAALRDSASAHDPDRLPPNLSPRLVMLHSFSHVLIRQLSFECGYSSSSLVERIYAGHAPYPMAGVLIHTGSPDADGTLGGLVRQGEVKRLGPTLVTALQNAEWCSSDPMCISDASAISTPENLAACHACLLIAETSCRLFNSFLDRAMLVGTPDDRSIGYFGEVLDMLAEEL